MKCEECKSEMIIYKDNMTKKIWYICPKCGKTILYLGE